MSSYKRYLKRQLIFFPLLLVGCSLVDQPPKDSPPFGLITTPAAYYSTPKARYLGQKYKENLDRLVERIVRNPKTANLQFANNIASVGGIGFFTHSAAKTPDERYLEVILTAPETFETAGEYSSKVYRLFASYGADLLSALSSDLDVYQEKEVSGYGLNLSWRRLASNPPSPRVALERAVVYFNKQKVRGFLKNEMSQNELLGEAIIFAVEDDGPMSLVSFRPQEIKPDFRPPIQEEIIATTKLEPKPESKRPISQSQPPPKTEAPKIEMRAEKVEPEQVPSREKPSPVISHPRAAEIKTEPKAAPPAADTPELVIASPPAPVIAPPKQDKGDGQKRSEPVAASKGMEATGQVKKASEKKPEASAAVPAPRAKARDDAPAAPQKPEPPQSLKTSEQVAGAAEEKSRETLTPVAKPMESKSDAAPGQHGASAKTTSAAPVVTEAAESQKTRKTEEPIARPKDVSGKKAAEVKPKPAVEEKKLELAAGSPKVDSDLPSLTTDIPRIPEPQKREKLGERKPQEPAVSTAPASKAPARPVGENNPQAAPAAPKAEDRAPEVKAAPAAVAKAPQKTVAEKSPSGQVALLRGKTTETPPEKKTESAPAASKVQAHAPEAKSPPEAVAKATQEKNIEKPGNERIALLKNKPVETVPEKKPLARTAPKVLEGYVIQLAFADKAAARRWADTLTKRGYAISMTEAESTGSVRVRIGNFTVRDEAERQLQTLRRDGLAGIVINLPQAYRPDVTTPASEGTGKTASTEQ